MERVTNQGATRLRDCTRVGATTHAELAGQARPREGVRGLLRRSAARRAAMARSAGEGDSAARPAILSAAIRREAR
jgi:hypothetical protein